MAEKDKETRQKIKKIDKTRELRSSALIGSIVSDIQKSVLETILEIERDTVSTPIEKLIKINEISSVLELQLASKVRAEFIQQYRAEIKAMDDLYAGLGYKKVTGYDSATLTAILDFDVDKVSKNLQAYTTDIRDTLSKVILTGGSFDIDQLINPVTNRIDGVLVTEVNTLFAGFSQTVNIKKAEDLGLDIFQYIGPEDDLARDFCRDILTNKDPAIYSIQEIQEIENSGGNGQGLPILQYGGGYNCRHSFAPISRDRAIGLGYEDDEDR